MKQSSKPTQAAAILLSDNRVLPVPIESIVRSLGIKLIPYDLGEDISGVLVIEGAAATIGYNKNEHRVRNRFTIAHELGHYQLHKGKDLFVDKPKMMFRNTSNKIYKQEEAEANEFAASILMPEDLLKQEMEILDLDCTEEASIKVLAKKFDVSSVAMSWRVYNLGLAGY
jgi:Zn-dependent peptidase ImmA (M78 family)